MSETKTPVEVAAEAISDWDPHAEGTVGVVFGSVDVDGLAEVLRAHRLNRWEVSGEPEPNLVHLICTCGLEFVMEEGVPDGAEEQLETVHEGHVAEATKRWMTNGTKEA